MNNDTAALDISIMTQPFQLPPPSSRRPSAEDEDDKDPREETLLETGTPGSGSASSSSRGLLRRSRMEDLRGIVSRKPSRETNVVEGADAGMMIGETKGRGTPRDSDVGDGDGTQDDGALASQDEARFPRRSESEFLQPRKAGSSLGDDLGGSLIPPPAESITTSGERSRTDSSVPSHLDPSASTSSFLLTLKPSKTSRRKAQDAADGSFEPDQTATTEGDDEQRRQTPDRRRDGESSEPRSSGKRPRERKGHPPPPRASPPIFTDFVLPHARVARAPTSGMYFSRLPSQGFPPPKALRAHTGTMVGALLYVIGGCDKYGCWPGVAVFNTETHTWRTLQTGGDVAFPPLRAHTTTLVGTTLYVFGGGDGPTYSNEVYAFDTFTQTWSKPRITTPARPPPRRAHTTVHYKHYLLVFGGGNGHMALNDVWVCDVADPYALAWHEWKATGDVPVRKGYHSANLLESKLVVYGGSDGVHSFADVHVLDVPSMVWTRINTDVQIQRLSHTSTQVGSYLFIVGGHDGQKYAQEVLLFNLVTLSWETKPLYGNPPAGRGYHIAVLHDSRLLISGGYDGHVHFGDLHALELASCAYLPQVTTFEVDEKAKRAISAETPVGIPADQPPKG